jgi:hypothetical protein
MGVLEQNRAGPLPEQVRHPGVAGRMVAHGIGDAIEPGTVAGKPFG